MSSVKPRLLLVWWYDRKDLIEPFLKIREDFDITVLFYRFKEQENKEIAESLPFRRIYWTQYLTPWHIIKDVRPDKIVLFGITSSTTLALMMTAKSMRIPFYYLSHGLIMDMDKVLENLHIRKTFVNVDSRYKVDNHYYTHKKYHSFLFLLLTPFFVKWKLIFPVFRFFWLTARKFNQYRILKKINQKYWLPDLFIMYAPYYARFFQDYFGIEKSGFRFIGPYILDETFKRLGELSISQQPEGYYLFIDQPLLEISFDERMHLILTLAENVTATGKKFILKIHPQDYHLKLDFQDKNITVVRECNDLAELIFNCEVCFGFHSALLLAIIPFRKCILFKHGEMPMVEEWGKTKAVQIVDTNVININELHLDNLFLIFEQNSKEEFIAQFVSYTDGKGTERLRSFLLDIKKEE